jgi:hypothetical protein
MSGFSPSSSFPFKSLEQYCEMSERNKLFCHNAKMNFYSGNTFIVSLEHHLCGLLAAQGYRVATWTWRNGGFFPEWVAGGNQKMLTMETTFK